MFCSEKHHLEDTCEEFMKKSFKERKNFFFRKRLCLGCASKTDHRIANCKHKKVCKICSKPHPTCLHQEKEKLSEEENEKQVSNGTSSGINVCSLQDQQDGRDHAMIVPVWVRPEGESSNEILQYAVLDDQSNVGFVSKSLCDKLNLQGQPTELLLTTVHERNAKVQSNRVCGLEILDFHQEHVVKLPVAFTHENIPANRSQIPKPEILQQWKHLSPIADQLMPYDLDIEISLLIGNNCTRVIRPREVIAGGEDEPYAQRSLLGWGVIGRVCKSVLKSDSCRGVCHKVTATETYQHFVSQQRQKK